MHHFKISENLVTRVTDRVGREHPFDTLFPERTALLVADMQNYFLKPGYMGEVPMARQIAPGVNQLAAALRRMGGQVIWIMNSTKDTRQIWPVFHDFLLSPEKQSLRYETLAEGHEGHELWPMLDVKPEDAKIIRKRFSAFKHGSSDIVAHLRQRGVDTVLISGMATNVCCESSAREAIMLNFRPVLVSDACATHSDAEHAASLSACNAIFRDVQTIDEAVASLARGARQAAA